VFDLADPLNSYTCTDPEDVSTCASLFGMGVPLVLSIFFLVVGVVLLILWWIRNPSFFRWKPEAYDVNKEPAQSFNS